MVGYITISVYCCPRLLELFIITHIFFEVTELLINVNVLHIQFTRVTHLFTLLWAALMTAYWCVTDSLLSDLYNRFNDDDNEVLVEGNEQQEGFQMLLLFSFLCMVGWVSSVMTV